MKLATITLDTDALRAALTDDSASDFVDFSEFAQEDPSFDYLLLELMPVLSGVLDSGNAALAGTRSHPIDGQIIEPTESIDATLVADSDGAIGGYTFAYSLWGARRLEVPTRYIEWRHLARTDEGGIEGIIEIAEMVVALCNAGIADLNEFVAGVSA